MNRVSFRSCVADRSVTADLHKPRLLSHDCSLVSASFALIIRFAFTHVAERHCINEKHNFVGRKSSLNRILLRSCCGSVDKTTDSQPLGPRFESAGSGSIVPLGKALA